MKVDDVVQGGRECLGIEEHKVSQVEELASRSGTEDLLGLEFGWVLVKPAFGGGSEVVWS